jgi:hypothetical protein
MDMIASLVRGEPLSLPHDPAAAVTAWVGGVLLSMLVPGDRHDILLIRLPN